MYDKALKHFQEVDQVLYNLGTKFKIRKIEPSKDLYVSLVREILGQQLSGKAAQTIFNRVEKLYPNDKITPEETLKIPDQTIRDAGCSWSKIKFIKDLSERIVNKQLNLESLRDLDNESVVLELTKVKGIGPWTAEMFLMFALGRPDIFSPGDLGLKNSIKKWYGIENPTPQDLLDISHKWSPFRTYACLILWDSLDNLNLVV